MAMVSGIRLYPGPYYVIPTPEFFFPGGELHGTAIQTTVLLHMRQMPYLNTIAARFVASICSPSIRQESMRQDAMIFIRLLCVQLGIKVWMMCTVNEGDSSSVSWQLGTALEDTKVRIMLF